MCLLEGLRDLARHKAGGMANTAAVADSHVPAVAAGSGSQERGSSCSSQHSGSSGSSSSSGHGQPQLLPPTLLSQLDEALVCGQQLRLQLRHPGTATATATAMRVVDLEPDPDLDLDTPALLQLLAQLGHAPSSGLCRMAVDSVLGQVRGRPV